MASEPTDLIREADEALDGITPAPWKIDEYDEGPLASIVSVADDRPGGWVEVARSMDSDARFIAAAPDLVRRLRDALTSTEYAADNHERALGDARALLAEANATIQRALEACDYLEDGPMQAAVRHIRRALDSPGAHEQCPECGGWDGFHGHVTRSVMGGEGEMSYGGIMSSPCPRRAIEGEQA